MTRPRGAGSFSLVTDAYQPCGISRSGLGQHADPGDRRRQRGRRGHRAALLAPPPQVPPDPQARRRRVHWGVSCSGSAARSAIPETRYFTGRMPCTGRSTRRPLRTGRRSPRRRSTATRGSSRPSGSRARPDGWSALLRHERLPFVSYPYEWPFSMLQRAALLQLDLLIASVESGLMLKDGDAVQRPVARDRAGVHRRRLLRAAARRESRGPATGSSASCSSSR